MIEKGFKSSDYVQLTCELYADRWTGYNAPINAQLDEKCVDCGHWQLAHALSGCMLEHKVTTRYCPCQIGRFDSFSDLIKQAQEVKLTIKKKRKKL